MFENYSDYFPLALVYLIYSAYALFFSLIVCLMIVFRSHKFWKTKVNLLLFLMFLMEIVTWTTTIICTSYYLQNEINLDVSHPKLCKAIGFIRLFSEFFKNINMLAICFFSYRDISQQKVLFKSRFFLVLLMVLLAMIIPSMVVFLDENNFRDNNNVECWLNEENNTALFVYYIPLMVIFLLCFGMLGLSLPKYYKNKNIHSKNMIKLFFFPIILLISYSAAIIRNVMNGLGYPLYDVLIYLDFILLPTHGIFSSLYYCFLKPNIIRKLKKFFATKQIGEYFLNMPESHESEEEQSEFMSIEN